MWQPFPEIEIRTPTFYLTTTDNTHSDLASKKVWYFYMLLDIEISSKQDQELRMVREKRVHIDKRGPYGCQLEVVLHSDTSKYRQKSVDIKTRNNLKNGWTTRTQILF